MIVEMGFCICSRKAKQKKTLSSHVFNANARHLVAIIFSSANFETKIEREHTQKKKRIEENTISMTSDKKRPHIDRLEVGPTKPISHESRQRTFMVFAVETTDEESVCDPGGKDGVRTIFKTYKQRASQVHDNTANALLRYIYIRHFPRLAGPESQGE